VDSATTFEAQRHQGGLEVLTPAPTGVHEADLHQRTRHGEHQAGKPSTGSQIDDDARVHRNALDEAEGVLEVGCYGAGAEEAFDSGFLEHLRDALPVLGVDHPARADAIQRDG